MYIATQQSLWNLHFSLDFYLYTNLLDARADDSSLRWLMGFKEPLGQLARWLGNNPLRRQKPCTVQQVLDNLPCGGCTYCLSHGQIHQKRIVTTNQPIVDDHTKPRAIGFQVKLIKKQRCSKDKIQYWRFYPCGQMVKQRLHMKR